MTEPKVFDDRTCTLGEGPLWHPERQQLFWFDIMGRKLMTRTDSGPQEWQFDEYFSAAGWVDHNTLHLASETGLWRFDIASGTKQKLIDIEANNTVTRSNDARADPFGGFWIGTMGKNAEPQAGSIYRFFKGELRTIARDITITNSICFSPDGSRAYYADTRRALIWSVVLDGEGWPKAEPKIFLNLSAEGLHPDGSVIDSEGALWNAQWGASRVARYLPNGTFDRAIAFPAPQCSCPAFGGPDFDQLFVTTATQGMKADERAAHPLSGQTFVVKTPFRGLAEHQVRL